MKKAYRQLLLFLAVTIFLTLGPLMVLYAMGYRFQIGDTETLPVGVILVETIPRRTLVDVDGRVVGQTPRSIANLEPGEKTVTLTKEGYVSWQKSLPVHPARVTEIRSTRLFPENPVITPLLSNVTTFNLSPNRNLIAAVTATNQLHILDQEGEGIIPPLALTQQPKRLLWSPDSSKIMIQTGNTLAYTDVTRALPRLVTIPYQSTIQEIIWDERVPGQLFIQSTAGTLDRLQVTRTTPVTIARNVTTFASSSKSIYVGTNDHELNIIDRQGKVQETFSFDENRDFQRFYITPAGQVALEFADQSLSLFTSEHTLLPIATNVVKAGWSPNGEILLVQTDESSLHVYNASDQHHRFIPYRQLHQVLRLSSPVREPQWFAGGNHIIHQVNDAIVITEIDTRDRPVQYHLDSTNLGNSLATVGAQGDDVLYLKNNANSTILVNARTLLEEQ